MTPKARAKEWASRLALTLFSILISAALIFAAGETYFRLRWGIGHYRAAPLWYTFHEERGWAPIPGEYDWFAVGAFRMVHVSINSLGFRGREVSLKVPPGRRRITIVGDSFAFGEALDAEERFSEQLEELTGGAVEIVNVSVPGYGTGQEYLFMSELIEKGYEVGEKLVFAFFANDVLDNLGLRYRDASRDPRTPAFRVDENGSLAYERPVEPPPVEPAVGVKRPLPARVGRWLKNRAFVHFLRNRAESLAGRYPWIVRLAEWCGVEFVPDRTPAIIVGWYTEGWQERWSATRDVLEYVTREGRFGATEVIVMYIPSSLQVERSLHVLAERFSTHDPRYADLIEDPYRPRRAVREFCVENGLPLIDATSALREAARENPVYYLREGHMNSWGSRQVALEIHRWLVERGDAPGAAVPSPLDQDRGARAAGSS